MEQITWTEDFSVGIPRLDEQHKQLVRMINRLIAAPGTKTKSESVSNLLNDMTKYAQEHFRLEEDLMRERDYPHLDEQVAQHRAFRKKVADFCFATMLDAQSVPDIMLNYLRDWLVNHILECDMAYKPYLGERKAKRP